MRFRKTRIAASVVSLMACVVVFAFWMRSYYWNDVYAIHVGAKKFGLQSATGRIWFVRALNTVSFHQRITNRTRLREYLRVDENVFGYHFHREQYTTDFRVQLPHWWLVALSLTFAALPWIRWRFRLRTLLIAIALVALVLGVLYRR